MEDSIAPGETIEFWFTKGPDQGDRLKGLIYRISRDGVTWSEPQNVNTPFSQQNRSDHRIYYQFIPQGGDKNRVKDWHQVIKATNGTSKVWTGNLVKTNPWSMELLVDLPDTLWRIPDLAPVTGDNPDLTIYTAVNMDLYLKNNPWGFLNGSWTVGQTLIDLGLSIDSGVIEGLEGIYWSTSEFVFDPNSTYGFIPIGGVADLLDSDTFPESIGIIAEHNSVPEPATMLLVGSALLGLAALRRRLKK